MIEIDEIVFEIEGDIDIEMYRDELLAWVNATDWESIVAGEPVSYTLSDGRVMEVGR